MLVLDANVLIRAALGSRVLGLLRKYAGQVEFMAPHVAFQEAQEHLPGILTGRKIPSASAMAILDLVGCLVQTVEAEAYSSFENVARERTAAGTKTIGPYWLRPSRSVARSGPKTPTSFGCGVAT